MSFRIGFIGLGLMGKPMCRNLIEAGHQIVVWNRTTSRTDEATKSGAKVAETPKELAADSDVVITIVSDSPDVQEVILGEFGVIEGIPPNSTVIDMSTISPSVTRMLSSKLIQKGVSMLDAPVSGGTNGAEAGTLSIMVGGDRQTFDRCQPIFKVMGDRVTYCGGSGMGQVTKLSNQIVGLGTLAAMCEGLVFAAKAGQEPDSLLSALSGGAANSWMIENLAGKVFDGDFDPGFMVKLAQKDLRLVLESADEMNMPLLTTPLVNQIFKSAQQFGLGDEGIHAYIKVLERLSGQVARRNPKD